ncbi:glycosyltransferase [Glaciecola siphonariae]|uniref:Glycosyltransferase n=1 Tax=Glaciecola siphonariae TaxID=521012 RepID=A0ABV9LW39_9ALTE
MPKSFYFIKPISLEHSFTSVVAMATYANDNPVWLEEAVNSVLAQDYRDFVFVIVIDGPIPDAIEQVLQKALLNDQRIVLAKSEGNVGLSRCMNFVMDWCLPYQPEYFFRMDADDISLPTRMSTQIAFLEQHEDVDVLGSALIEINEVGKQVGARTLPSGNAKLRRNMSTRCPINHPTVVLRFSALEQGFRYRNDLKNTQDYFLWIELMEAGFKFHNLKQPLLKFRRVNDFYKRRGITKSINEFKARIFAMRALKRMRLRYLVYACAVLVMRCLPPPMVKLAYKFDRYVLNR